MAETYSVEYTNQFITRPGNKNYAYGARPRKQKITYTQVLAGAANDTILLMKVPPQSAISMFDSWLRWSTFTSGATLSLGWQAYKDQDGATQALSATGLLSAVSLTVDGAWSHGMLVVATPDDSLPVPFDEKEFNNREMVTIYATIGSQAPGVGAKLSGRICVYLP